MSLFSISSLPPPPTPSSSVSSHSSSLSSEDDAFDEDEEKLPKYKVEFEWPYEGERVFLACSYLGWAKYVPMRRKLGDCNAAGLTFDDKQKTWVYSHPSKNPFYTTLDLPAGQHQYKFIVDGKWYFDIKKPNLHDPLGNINNYVDVSPEAFPPSSSSSSQ